MEGALSTGTDMIWQAAADRHPELVADELDKMWADFGRNVHHNMMRPALIMVLNRACLTAKSHIELAAMVRTYLLTGVVP